MFEDGSWEKPHRPRKSDEHIPIEEVSQEDLRPGYDSGPKTPEELLIEEEEMVHNSFDVDALNRYEHKERDQRIADLREAIAGYEASRNEVDDPAIRKSKVRAEGSGRPAQGWRGKEPIDKHNKGKSTIRKSDSLER
jgi:hypothetical protein